MKLTQWQLMAAFFIVVTARLFADELPAESVPGHSLDGSNPEPAPSPLKLVVDENDILSSQTKILGGRRITLQKVIPMEFPEPPAGPADEPTGAGRVEQVDPPAKPHRNVMLGASVHLPNGNPEDARTFIQLWNPDGRTISLWSNANFLWLTGFAQVEAGDETYSFLMAVSEAKTQIPENLNFPAGAGASIIITEGQPTAEDLAPIHALLAIYNDPRELEKLRGAYDSRRRDAAEREAALAADPPEKKSMILRYWRTDAAGQEGITPKPADLR